MNTHNLLTAIWALPLIIAISLPAHLLAGNAKMTVYTKGASPQVFLLDSVKNVSFMSANPVIKESEIKIPAAAFRALPSRQSIAFQCTGKPGSIGSLEVYAINGRIITSQSFRLSVSGEKRIDLLVLGRGMYIARYKNGTKIITKNVLRHY